MSFAEKPIKNTSEQVNSKEAFNQNAESIEQKKQAITEAVTAGDYEKVAALAQEAKSMEAARNEMMGETQADAEIMNTEFNAEKARLAEEE